MFESKKLMKRDIDILKAEAKVRDDRIDRLYERVDQVGQCMRDRFEIYKALIEKPEVRIDELENTIRQLANLLDCKISSPTPASKGGVVSKMSKTEIATKARLARSYKNTYYTHLNY